MAEEEVSGTVTRFEEDSCVICRENDEAIRVTEKRYKHY